MKIPQSAYLLLVFCASLLSCKPANKYSYAIKDFNKPLQPYLTKAVSKGIVDDNHSIEKTALDDELTKLSQSEHPILRSIAFKIMLKKQIFNHFDLIMDNLDDTAIVAIDHGEWGIDYKMVADYIIGNGRWKNMADKNKTIDVVLTKHNNLKSAYDILPQIEPQKKYYAIIKEMAQRDEDFDKKIINALYALAKFKKKEDIVFIKDILLKHDGQMPDLSFSLMETYPNEAYFEIYKNHYLENFYWCLYHDKEKEEAERFIRSVASFKNKSSADILDTLLNKKVFFMPYTLLREREWKDDWKVIIVEAINNNDCEAYSRFKKQVSDFVIEKRKEQIRDSIFNSSFQKSSDVDLYIKRDTVMEPIKW